MKHIANFWKSGLTAKIITVLVSIITACCCCVSASTAVPTPSASEAVLTSTALPDATGQSPTLTVEPAAIVAVASATLIPSFAPPPTFTQESISTATVSSQGQVRSQEASLKVSFIDVGQGDAILIQTGEGLTALIDGGDIDSNIVQYLQSVGVQHIDWMIATHPHADHIGGLVQVLKMYPVKRVVTNGQAHTTTVYENFLDGIASAQAEYFEAKRGDLIELGTLDILVFNPAGNTNPDLNENSLVLQFTYGATTFLLMGDSGATTEANLLASGLPLKTNILKVGHHGSTSGSTSAFLNAIKPEVAVYTAGINNSYGHPAPETIAALSAAGATIYGTDQNGTVVVNADQVGYKVQTQKSGTITAPVLSTPTIAAAAPAFSGLEIVSVTSPISRGATASLTARAAPNASCSITVYYKSGASSAAGLGPKTADSNGMVSWSWKVGARTTPGTWRIVVTCNQVTQETTFTVQ